MDIKVTYSDVLAQCEKLSSFEGREALSPDGETRYPEVHITSQDEDLINTFTLRGLHELEQQLGRLVSASASTTTDYTLTIEPYDSSRLNKATVSNMAMEAVSAYVMYSWLTDRNPTRVQFYTSLFDEMCKSLIIAIVSKRKPLLTDLT